MQLRSLVAIDNLVPSQVVKQKTISKQQGLTSVATKIAIQMNQLHQFNVLELFLRW